LERAQKADIIDPFYKIQLTQGANDDTFEQDRILPSEHIEEAWSQRATIVLDNSDGAITADYKGYKGVISYGIKPPASSGAATYSACAPLWVVGPKKQSGGGSRRVELELIGIPDLMAMDGASAPLFPGSGDGNTVKQWIQALLGSTLYPSFIWPTAYSAPFDREDNLIDSFKPADAFTIKLNETRLAVLRQLLAFTKCYMRAENDTAFHIIVPPNSYNTWVAATKYELNDYVQPTSPNNNFTYRATAVAGDQKSADVTEPTWPTTAGNTVVDDQVTWTAVAPEYEYDLTPGGHNFFDQANRTRVVMPNYVVVKSHPDHDVKFEGVAEDTTFTSLDGMEKRWYEYLRLASVEEAAYVAAAILQGFKRGASVGSALVPMNVGQEVHDWVKVTDPISGDVQLGNVGYIRRTCGGGKWEMQIAFGDTEHDPFLTYAILAPPAIPPEILAQIAALQPLIAAQEELFLGIR